ncbi:MAG TPA: hypothetical protein VFV67_25690 [Actinophytocola sp.]|uniref:hypothetical protein n=1 Tax=Actinophytocola sp. TaxID=1872138 RepID=UPI002DBF9442|nr:hypothetical protein [Actinophytocola sp.]HEU5474052.1 hypothetical protein [Actinophytocola sp.]
MSEQDVRDGLRAAVLTEPVLSFDPEALILRARQQVRRRRALAGAGAATIAVAVAAVAVPTVLGTPRGSDGGAVGAAPPPSQTSPPHPTPAITTLPWPPAGVTPVSYTADQLKVRGAEMRDHLRAAFPAAVPGVAQVAVQEFGGEASGAVEDGQGYLNSFVAFSLDGSRSAVYVATFAPGAGPEPFSECGDGCKVATMPDGSHVLTGKLFAGEGQWLLNVWHFRANGAVVQATGYNYDPTGAGPTLPVVPVTPEQLAALATDPKLGI